MGISSFAINPALQPNLPYRKPMRGLTPIGTIFRSAFVLQVLPSVPALTRAKRIV